MASKSRQLQIRVTPEQKAALKRRAERAGQDMSSYVLSRALPGGQERFEQILDALRDEASHRYALAELSDFLWALASSELAVAMADAELRGLSPFLRSYVAAMVEVAAHRKGVDPPRWTAGVGGLDQPYFASDLRGLRLHLLRSSPVPFKRRNIFVDATVGDRV